jgi:hypothetical protein
LGSGTLYFNSGETNSIIQSAGNFAVTAAVGNGGASAGALSINSSNTLNTAGDLMFKAVNNGTTVFSVDFNGKTIFGEYTNNAGTPGNTTINKVTGRAAIASAASSCVVTNSTVTSSSIITVQCETTGAGVADLVVSSISNGSFTVTSVGGTGVITVTTNALTFSFIVHN